MQVAGEIRYCCVFLLRLKRFAHVLSQRHDMFRAEPSVILARCDDINSDSEDIYETVDDEDYIFVPSGQSNNSEAEFEHDYDNASSDEMNPTAVTTVTH